MKLATKPSVWESLNKHCGGKLYPLLEEWVKAHPASATPEKCDPEFFAEELAQLSRSQEKSPFITSLQEWAGANRHYQWLEIAADLSKTASRIAGYKFPTKVTQPKLEKPAMAFHAGRDMSIKIPRNVPVTEFNYANPLNNGEPIEIEVEVLDDAALRMEIQTDDHELAKALFALPALRNIQTHTDLDPGTCAIQTGIWIKPQQLAALCSEVSTAYRNAGHLRPKHISLKFSQPLEFDGEEFSVHKEIMDWESAARAIRRAMRPESPTAFPSAYAQLQRACDLAVQNRETPDANRTVQIQAACEEFTRLYQPRRSLAAVLNWCNNSLTNRTPAQPEIT